MYKDFFQLRQMPFSLTPDTGLFFNLHSHRSALNTLLVALRNSEGFIKIVGEVGTGKTILCRKLLSCLDENFITAYIPNPFLSPEELKNLFAEEIGVIVDGDVSAYRLLSLINARLIDLAHAGKQVVLVIDEAQAMPCETLEALRLLTNLETGKRKLLQVVLLGQPELDVKLERQDLRQLKQRIVFAETLRRYSMAEVASYMAFRLTAAGCKKNLFTPMALRLLAAASGGVARMINILAHKSLLVAYGRGDGRVTTLHVARAVADTGESHWLGKLLAWRWHLLWPALGSASVLLFILGSFGVGGLS